jgi:hypothetical protein
MMCARESEVCPVRVQASKRLDNDLIGGGECIACSFEQYVLVDDETKSNPNRFGQGCP